MDEIDMSKLQKLIEICRRGGVLKLQVGGMILELELKDQEKPLILENTPSSIDKPSETLETARGADGLTAQEQMDLYGAIIDAKE